MLNILFEDQSIIVAEKPAGLESQATRKLEPDMVSEIRNYIHKLSTDGRGKTREPYVGVIHRLDKPVGGIMVYARTREAAKLQPPLWGGLWCTPAHGRLQLRSAGRCAKAGWINTICPLYVENLWIMWVTLWIIC